MNVGELIARCRLDANLSLRALAQRAGTSHSTLSAYENGRKSPSLSTLRRILDATGYELVVDVRRTPLAFDPEERGEQIVDLIELGQLFPSSHAPELKMPVFGRR